MLSDFPFLNNDFEQLQELLCKSETMFSKLCNFYAVEKSQQFISEKENHLSTALSEVLTML